MSSIQHTYRYLQPSALHDGSAPRLALATSDGQAHPHFFEGRLLQPRLIAELLAAVHLVVGSRFFTPPGMLERLLALADPVVTSGGGLLRFEGFSACCSAYIRADLLPDAYVGEVLGKGTTNVDFNAPMRAVLARVRDGADLHLSVGREALELRASDETIVERKVPLPVRWLRGMVEVQAYQAAMQPCFQVPALDLVRLLRSLPRAGTRRTPLWVAPASTGLASTTRPSEGAVRLTEAARLRVLEPLLPRARQVQVFADPRQQANAWVLDFGSARLTLVLSSEVWRGFSGEGQALSALIQATGDGAALARVRAALNWQAALEPAALAAQIGSGTPQVDHALRVLGASGLVGFDVAAGHYFHRVLPFDLGMSEDLHPRLLDARALLNEGALERVSSAPLQVDVSSGGVVHRVREVDGELQCTCPWFSRFQGLRGPCKHVLAASTLRPSHS
ncbi:TPA: SWIM zinc finger family protein [Stenotrophomonas maltophilia]|nr:SWIM zinc finger family protein [Stenotrophomonas maltophilia]HDS1041258.1 SWIM zinc finger family protein [Stenotrophomonas maltophilia]HDS1041534.1 SWIM zinc finger family protein [Stenotrophomonas maltophilia]